MIARLPALLAAFWWVSLTTIGFVVVPLLFMHLPTPAVAGQMAAKLFQVQTWIAVACGFLLLMLSKPKHAETQSPWAKTAIIFVLAGLLLALLVQFGVAPRIVARENLGFWHPLGTAMYALEWLCAGIVLWRILKPLQTHPESH